MSTVDISHSVSTSFVVLSDSFTFEAGLSSVELSVMSLLGCSGEMIVPAPKKITESMVVVLSLRKSTLRMFQSLESENPAFRKLETDQISHVLKASLAIDTHAVDNLTIPHGSVPVKTDFQQIMHLLENVYKYATLFKEGRKRILFHWSEKRRGHIYRMNV